MADDDFDKSSDFNKGGTPSLPSVTEATVRYLEHHRKKYATQVRQLEQCIAAAISRGEPEVTINCEYHNNLNENVLQRFISDYLSWLGYPVIWHRPSDFWAPRFADTGRRTGIQTHGLSPDSYRGRDSDIAQWVRNAKDDTLLIHLGEESSIIRFVTGIITWGPGRRGQPPDGPVRKVWLMNPDNHHRRNEP